MSWVALAWASKLRVERASDKLILLALADRHNDETGFAYPSVAWLCEFSSLNRKTVIASLDRLEANGLIADSGKRIGATKQVKVYSVLVEKTEPSQKRNSSENGRKQSQKRDTEPVSNQHSGSKEPSLDKSRRGSRIDPDWRPTRTDLDFSIAQKMSQEDINHEADQFRDFWLAKPGAGGCKLDWAATWRTWCRNRRGRPSMAGGSQAYPSRSRVEDLASIVARRHAGDAERVEIPGGQASIFDPNDDWSSGAIEGEYRSGHSAG